MSAERGQVFTQDPSYRDDLRKAFEPAQIGKLPRITQRDGVEKWCEVCKQKVKPHIHIDYLGHANVTDRLNHVAPDWTYTIDHIETGAGHILGIQGTMTIGGKSIPEAGSVESRGGNWGDELKLAISDFICRGAMRFGVGLDLWIKGEAAHYDSEAGDSPENPLSSVGVAPDPASEHHSPARGNAAVDDTRVTGEGALAAPKAPSDPEPTLGSATPHTYEGDNSEPCKVCQWAREHPVHGKAA